MVVKALADSIEQSHVSSCHQQTISRHCNKGAVTIVLSAEICMVRSTPYHFQVIHKNTRE
eukprot:1534541-Ditylum_brightwellii.AAC.1